MKKGFNPALIVYCLGLVPLALVLRYRADFAINDLVLVVLVFTYLFALRTFGNWVVSRKK